MYDYMIALKERFYQPLHTEWDDQIQMLRRELASQMDKPHRKKLLRLLDAESMLQEEISLASFVAGFRLATGIARELSLEESYSFAKEPIHVSLTENRNDVRSRRLPPHPR